jgi:hypothetical protein
LAKIKLSVQLTCSRGNEKTYLQITVRMLTTPLVLQ